MIRGAAAVLAAAGLIAAAVAVAGCPKREPGPAVPTEVELDWPDAGVFAEPEPDAAEPTPAE